ncbi:hypothetical protein N5C93_23390 [Pseudomonas nitroreducens]|uniref:hypothetical protein n=1 Tax=Pseudomonas nitroreducens TaxID=46680 RepID=UPI00147393DB|nr:hypothetical protein [Pseudomonas nitroreducens]MDG9856957.1 hypothetical protein [Pseudomonas nitroreducens]MDH1075785.1 hypothetical protein [Pseudomonas nitroreducens]NMZ76668.1 hypothetical protein [Pseudomonas nitroreducens]
MDSKAVGKAAQEKQVAPSFVSHWKQVLSDLDVEHDLIEEMQKEQLCHVYEAAANVCRFPTTAVTYPGDERKVESYLFGRGMPRRWWLHDAVPQRFHCIPEIPDSECQRVYNVSARLQLIIH